MTINTVQHKNILLKILKDIFSDAILGSALGFKGGTAALLFYGLSRFSIDLDFDLLDPSKEHYVFEQIKKILEKYGTLKEAQIKRYSLFFLLSYDHKMPGSRNIKVEVNKRAFGSHYEVKEYLGIPMHVMNKQDMAAHKMVAMYERMGKANRDIYDVWYFLSNHWPINTHIIEQRTGMSYKEFLQACIDKLENMSNQGILSGIGELLDNKQKAWAKQHLRSETIFLLRLAMQT
jgi:predicted nucleotidyltransferase component of viral defense system